MFWHSYGLIQFEDERVSTMVCMCHYISLYVYKNSTSCVDLHSQSFSPSVVTQRMNLCLEFRSTTTVHSHQQILTTNSESTNFEYGQSHHSLRINLGMHHEILHELSIHRDVLNLFFIHHVLRPDMLSNNSFTPLLDISSIFFSVRIQHFLNGTTLSFIHLVEYRNPRNCGWE